MILDPFVREALLSDDPVYQKLRLIHAHLRSRDRKHSLEWVCRVASIPSKGLLSDFFRGRRPLPKKYATGLASALGLEGDAHALVSFWLVREELTAWELRYGEDEAAARLEAIKKAKT